MKKLYILLLPLLLSSLSTLAKNPRNQYVRIKTNFGVCVIRLYNQTPKHRDNFIKLVKKGFYNGTLFHRVIQNFMIQGGDPTSSKAKPGEELGNGDVGYTVDAEFNDSLFHKRGVLAAARENDDVNPKKASSGCQFYIVQGKRFTSADLDALQQTRLKGRVIPQWQRDIYTSVGGTPHLDQNYTVFGEVVIGMDMVDRIAAVARDANDRPKADIAMTIELLSRRQCRQMDKLLFN
jgi:cyclophilin family peptidyl-prolyl cis-trans isomerase